MSVRKKLPVVIHVTRPGGEIPSALHLRLTRAEDLPAKTPYRLKLPFKSLSWIIRKLRPAVECLCEIGSGLEIEDDNSWLIHYDLSVALKRA